MNEELSIVDLVANYENYLRSSFDELWSKVDIEFDKLDAYSVIGGLLARQVTLSIELARSPNTWNGHSAPLFLRAMTDLHIALAWIIIDLEERAKKYILHGLGEEKLLMEHYKKEIEDNPDDDLEQLKQIVEFKKMWINSQRHDFFVEVNLGNWSQLDYRRMSQEAECESLYKFAYKPFSHVAHNMWPHISMYNCKVCNNPLHKHHLIPNIPDMELEVDYLYRSCKYVDKAYRLFADKFSITLENKMPLDWWHDYFTVEEE